MSYFASIREFQFQLWAIKKLIGEFLARRQCPYAFYGHEWSGGWIGHNAILSNIVSIYGLIT